MGKAIGWNIEVNGTKFITVASTKSIAIKKAIDQYETKYSNLIDVEIYHIVARKQRGN